MEYTTNLNLKKPDINEYYNIVEQENENADIIDEAIGKLNSDVGTEELTTEAQDCKGAINELNKKTIYTKEATATIATGASVKEITNITVPAGTYLIVRKASFGINADGRRGIGSGGKIYSTVLPVSIVATEMSYADIYKFEKGGTLSIGVIQTSGMNLSVTGSITAVKL